jgi:hypothetical protein
VHFLCNFNKHFFLCYFSGITSSSSCIFPVQEKRKELDGNCTGADENDEKNGNDKSTCNSEITCNKNKKQRKSNSSEEEKNQQYNNITCI